MKCNCGGNLLLPAWVVGYTIHFVPVAVFQCDTCGLEVKGQLETMKPYTALRSVEFPPKRGEYVTVPDGTLFSCPVCQNLSPIKLPTHKINDDGKVEPSVVCPNACGFHTMMTLKDYNV